MKDLRTPQQIAISQGMKVHWKKRKAGKWVKPDVSEAQLHRSVADFLRKALKPPTTWTTIAHGGGGRVRGAQLKAAGLVPGWPDILIIDRGPNVIGIELKAKKGSQQPAQRMIAQAFHDVQAWYVLCRSVDEVEKALRFCKVTLHASVPT